jgi:hypothetical protein
MAGQGFLARVAGKTKQLFGIQSSTGAPDAGKIPALDATGKLDPSLLPTGIGANTVSAVASEALTAGAFVNLFQNAGAMGVRLADNSNGRPAHGYVNSAFASGATVTVNRLNTVNANRSGLTIGAEYWLGTAGGVITAPLDANDPANVNKADQYLGIAKSATELVTTEFQAVYL